MKKLVSVISILLLPLSMFSQRSGISSPPDFEKYKELNDKETKLAEFKDNNETLRMKLLQIDVINKSRKRYRASPVKLDILASRVANRMCMEAAKNNYISHWNLAGEKPYQRYAFAGGYDHVSENVYGEWTSGSYDISFEGIAKMMTSGHKSFMSERAPNDGHKKNIIDKTHNFVGIGFFASETQFRYNEEFIDRYLEFENIPAEVKPGEQCKITVKTNAPGYLYYIIIYRENWPQPLTPDQISRKGSYRDFTNEQYKEMFAWDLSRYRNGTIYEIPMSFSKEGLYYIQIFTDKKEITKPASLNTKGKMPESGIVIKVTR